MGALLDSLEIASPCPADWEDMAGDDRVRFCGLCRKSVYNLSGMGEDEAEALLARGGDRCVRLFRREDGTALTRDCPIGLAARLRRSARRRWAALGGFALSVLGVSAAALAGDAGEGCSLEAAPPPAVEAPAARPAAPPAPGLPLIDQRRIDAVRGGRGYRTGRVQTIQVIKAPKAGAP